ncbi:hypothetical protein Plec18170_002173 [Paecilomyces lecythidis]
MGYVNVAFSAGTVTGPFIGGVVYSMAGYDAVMGVAVGLLGLDIILRLLIVEKRALHHIMDSSADDEAIEDVMRPLLGTPTPSTYNINTQTSYFSELRATQETEADIENEVAYKTLMHSRHLVVLLGCAIVQATMMSSFEVTLPLHLRDIFNYDPKGTGLAFIPLVLPTFFSPVIDTLDQIGMFCDLLLIGTAMCMIMTPVLTEIFVAVEDLEEEKPGRFGPYGAYAQAVSITLLRTA